MRYAGELVRPGQNAGDEAKRNLAYRQRVGTGAHMRQRPRERSAELPQMEKSPECQLPGMGAELLIRRRNHDGLSACFEFDYFGHRLVSRSRVALLLCYLHRINNSQTVTSFPTASLRLRRCFRLGAGSSS